MEEAEIKVRLIEAAAQLPAVRAQATNANAAEAAHIVADLWYNRFVKVKTSAHPAKGAGKKK